MIGILLFGFFSFSYAETHHPQEFLRSISGSEEEGQQIVQHFCANCHADKPLIPMGAPRIGHKTDWEPRIKAGIENLLKHTSEGLNAMPARGGCFECTDKQLLLAIFAMLPQESAKELLSEQ
ncbi:MULTISPECIES: cytochrome c5 family protein [unclassified Legionella]|uniref:c-type cytochrome n=1 Tax=unclassified Legionella TaxID=2622702 RepID=UPI00105489F3|nr:MULTISPECIES: c-type cytochrome [unclassified Legionella]MDI9819293.1 c-type cytochrome [Legionella sp. PL877]